MLRLRRAREAMILSAAGVAAAAAIALAEMPSSAHPRTHPVGVRAARVVEPARAPQQADASTATAVPTVDAAPATGCDATRTSLDRPAIQMATGTAVVSADVHNTSSGPCVLDATSLGKLAARMLDLPAPQGSSASEVGGDHPSTSLPPGASTPLQVVVPDAARSSADCAVQVASGLLGTAHAVDLSGPCAAPPPLPAAPSQPPPPPSLPSTSALPAPAPPVGLPPAPPGVPAGPTPPVPAAPIPPAPGAPGLPPAPSLPAPVPQPLTPSPASSTQPARYPSGSTGYDISWPQCGGSYPPQSAVAVVGVNDGRAFTGNPCLGSEGAWAGSELDTYMNLNSPSGVDQSDSSGPAGTCGANQGCLAYNYGYNAAENALQLVSAQHLVSRMWWLDIETVGSCAGAFPTGGQGYWSCNKSLNADTVQGALDALRGAGEQAGVYSTSYQWGVITGGYTPSGGAPPNWLAGDDASSPSSWCSGSHDFAGGPPWLLQLWPAQTYDKDQAC